MTLDHPPNLVSGALLLLLCSWLLIGLVAVWLYVEERRRR